MTSPTDVPSPPTSARAAIPTAIVTRSGERVLRDELARLKNELNVEFPQRLREARDFGEGGANDDHLQIKEEEAVLRSRIARLESLLDTATVAESETSENGVIGIGTIVEVEDAGSGRRATHRVIGSFTSQQPGDVSGASPFGRALLGRSVGDTVEVELPGGRSRSLTIVAVDREGQTSR